MMCVICLLRSGKNKYKYIYIYRPIWLIEKNSLLQRIAIIKNESKLYHSACCLRATLEILQERRASTFSEVLK